MTDPVDIKIKANEQSGTIRKDGVVFAFDRETLPIVLDAFNFVEIAGLHKIEVSQITDMLARINLRINKPS
jgi:hypothetical protein